MRRLISLVLGLLAAALVAAAPSADGGPSLSHTLFDNLPARLVYLDDTSIVFYHDMISRNVWKSTDEGTTWNILEGVPQGESYMLLEHPYNTRVAFILTAGTTHYRTTDRGATFQAFTVPLPPSVGANTLSFHATKEEYILYTGQKCESTGMGGWKTQLCHDETLYTLDAFSSAAQPLMTYTSRCIFAHEKPQYAPLAHESLVYCVAFEPPSNSIKEAVAGALAAARPMRDSRLYSSTDFFKSDQTLVDLGLDHKEARGIVGIGGVSKFLVTAMKPPSSTDGEMLLYVTEDGHTWSRALFPHGHGLKENAYTIVESTSHSLIVDINSSLSGATGHLFRSNSNGTYFTLSVDGTNRNKFGLVDYEKLVGVEGVAIVNTVKNRDEAERGQEKIVQTKITFDEGGSWSYLQAPSKDNDGKNVKCDVSDPQTCGLHLHSVTQPHNYGRVFSSAAPGLVMGVGSIGDRLLPYDECDTFLSTDAGISWTMVEDGAMKYEFGDDGSTLVIVDDEDPTEEIKYSFDFGKTWQKKDIGVKIRSRLLTTIPDSTSLKFILLGTLTKHSKDKGAGGERHVIVSLDFGALNKRKCGDADMERWYARKIGGQADCLMGHKQWFLRRKPDADCVVKEEFKDPVGVEENCPCSDEDYECDYNFAPDGAGACVAVGPEPIPEGQCLTEGAKFRGSSGWRLIPGNTCDVARGIKKDEPKEKPCHAGIANPGVVSHHRFQFPGFVVDQAYFGESHTILAFTSQNRVWQSSNEGFSWAQVGAGTNILAMTLHAYDKSRAYLITDTKKVFYTTDKGMSWNSFDAPADPNALGIPLLDFHPLRGDWLIWTGMKDCGTMDSPNCRAVSYYTTNNGRKWNQIDEYVRVCSWGRDARLKLDERIIFCESYEHKTGTQRGFFADTNPLQLVVGKVFYGSKKVLFGNIVGFATFEEYMVVAELYAATRAIGLKISLDGETFALAKFPPNMRLENQAYTVLESSTDSVFLHVTTHADRGSEWGTLFKSNSNGTYYSPSLDYVNRNTRGFVDFEKMIGLDGIAVMNVVSNPDEAALSGNKKLQTKITHNDGGRWKALTPPRKDALGRPYGCTGTGCALHLHGYTERRDVRTTYSSPSAVGLMLAVGNVGESLVSYTESDTFLTRDGGFTWEEVHKDAHMWEYGDQGSILLLVNDEEATDHVTFTLDEGLTWQDYSFEERIRVQSIQTVPMDTSRKFILFGISPDKPDQTIAIQLDLSSVTNVKCKLDTAHPDRDDFELWSPSEEREERCLFGRQTMYYRRIRDRNCYIGERLPQPHKMVKNCACTLDDFECEFNYRRDDRGNCVLVEGAEALPSDDTCAWNQEFWFDRTSMRKIPHSTCEGGLSLDQGSRHVCPGAERHGWLFWGAVWILPFGVAGLAAVWWSRRRGGHGRIRLPEPGEGSANKLVELLVSIPYFVVGVVGTFASWASEKAQEVEVPWLSELLRKRTRGGYRHIALDDDAELLRDYDSDE